MIDLWPIWMAAYTSLGALFGSALILPWCARRDAPYPSLARYMFGLWLPWPWTLVRICWDHRRHHMAEHLSAATLEARTRYLEHLDYWRDLAATGSPAEQALAHNILSTYAILDSCDEENQ